MSFGFQKGKGARDVIGLMRIISERVLDIKEEMFLCFIFKQKVLTVFGSNSWKCLEIFELTRGNADSFATYTWDKE